MEDGDGVGEAPLGTGFLGGSEWGPPVRAGRRVAVRGPVALGRVGPRGGAVPTV